MHEENDDGLVSGDDDDASVPTVAVEDGRPVLAAMDTEDPEVKCMQAQTKFAQFIFFFNKFNTFVHFYHGRVESSPRFLLLYLFLLPSDLLD